MVLNRFVVASRALFSFLIHCEFHGTDAFAFQKDISMNWTGINDSASWI